MKLPYHLSNNNQRVFGRRKVAIEYDYWLAYEGSKQYHDVRFKDLVALQIYDYAGDNGKIVGIRFATRNNCYEVLKQTKNDYMDAWITLSYDLTPYNPRKGEIKYREYMEQRNTGITRPIIKRIEKERQQLKLF